MIQIRLEEEKEYKKVEEIIRKAFWNLYIPGCVEHYLAHTIRHHDDFVKELDFVIEAEGNVVGNVMYTKAKLVDEKGGEKEILTFGPVCIAPEYQRKGYGKMLLEHSFEKAISLGYDTIVIFGNPGNYVTSGFKSCLKYNVSLEDGSFPAAMLVKELQEGVLSGKKWVYRQSPAFEISEEAAEKFDAALEPMEKGWQPSQEEFYIMSHATVR